MFLELDGNDELASLRSNATFRNRDNEEHHLVGLPSPLESLDVDMVLQFPLDYMHLVCLGVMRRMLNAWVKKGKFIVRLSSQMISEFSTRLEMFRKQIPSEFARKPRALKYIDRWKASELRQFLLYTGPILGEGILDDNVLKHFRLLSSSIFILASPDLSKNLCDYASQLIEKFVSSSPDFYGKEFIVQNVHSLTHLSNDVKRFGPLDYFSAFPFENHLQLLKKKMRSPNKPLQQLFKRVNEKQQLLVQKNKINQVVLKKPYKDNNNLVPNHARSFKKVLAPSFCVSIKSGDNCFKLKNGHVIKVRHIHQTNTKYIMIIGNL